MNGKNWIGFRDGTQKKIEQGLFRVLRKKASTVENLATQNVKDAFNRFRKAPVDTGYTKSSTHVKVGVGNRNMLIRFITPNDKESGDGKRRGYAVFPLLGLSTSAKYGNRNWLKKGAELTKERIINNFTSL